MREALKIAWLCAAMLAMSPAGGLAQQHDKNPYASPDDVAEGRRMYFLYCVGCHGQDGKRPGVTQLASKFRRFGNADAEMFRTISNGIPGTRMPARWLEEKEIWQILAFVRTLEEEGSAGCEVQTGDAQRGRVVFREKGACLNCHTVGYEGGRLGPDLTYIGATRAPQQVREALLEPDKEGVEFYRAVKVTTGAGQVFDGVVLGEDDYSIHLMDRRETIHSFYKSELRQTQLVKSSIMPAYGDLLSDAEINDLLSYLCTLRGHAKKETGE